jgi:hypothetical protein
MRVLQVARKPRQTALLLYFQGCKCAGFKYIGTMVSYETGFLSSPCQRKRVNPSVHPCISVYARIPEPFEEGHPDARRVGRKVKYMRGSLFYREGDQTLVEPTGGDIDAQALNSNSRGLAREREVHSFWRKIGQV